jgi:hypothetical protein
MVDIERKYAPSSQADIAFNLAAARISEIADADTQAKLANILEHGHPNTTVPFLFT